MQGVVRGRGCEGVGIMLGRWLEGWDIGSGLEGGEGARTFGNGPLRPENNVFFRLLRFESFPQIWYNGSHFYRGLELPPPPPGLLTIYLPQYD